MTPEEPSAGVFYLLVGMFLVGAVVLAKVFLWYRQWRSPVEGSQLSMEEAREEFGQLMSERLSVAMRSAELDKVIIDCWNMWPVEYRPALYQVLRHAQLLEETMFEEAVGRGIYPRRLLEGPMIAPREPSGQPLSEEEPSAVPEQSGWIEVQGQLVRSS